MNRVIVILAFVALAFTASCSEEHAPYKHAEPLSVQNVESLPRELSAEAREAVKEPMPEASALPDNLLFKYLYEYWNNWQHPASELFVFQEMHVPEDNPIRFAELSDVVGLIESGQTAVVYLGFPYCPWCRVFVPVFLDVAAMFGVEEVFYRNISEDRNVLELREGEIYEVRAGCAYYYRLMELLGDWTSEYTGLEDPEIRRIFVPAFIFIKEGEVIFLQGYMDSHTERIADDPRRAFQELTDEEIEELSEIFFNNFSIVFPFSAPPL